MQKPAIATISATHRVGSFGWRHVLAWRQLSSLWRVPVVHYLGTEGAHGVKPLAYSMALRYGECPDDIARKYQEVQTPVVAFLDGAGFAGSGDGLILKFQEYYCGGTGLRHVYRLQKGHALAQGLPPTVSIHGPCPAVTPLRVEPGMDVLVCLNEIPIIAVKQHRLLVGADPWQFGAPSLPMLYKILSNWLIRETGCQHRLLAPRAAIRLDDLPTTAEQLRTHRPGKRLDRARSRAIRRLRKFAKRTTAKFTLMYSSHFRGSDGTLRAISTAMPRSIREMQLGVEQGVFEIGSHGMIHLRNWSDPLDSDPREFVDLESKETLRHLEACEGEIARLFGGSPKSFVAPAWGYRAGVTKEIAARRYPILVDSSQHVECGACGVFSRADEGYAYANAVETFRTSDRLLCYSEVDFWRCYAAAGIPVHYMQHRATNWQILRNFLASKPDRSQARLQPILARLVDSAERPRSLRVLSATALFVLKCWAKPAWWKIVWMMLTQSSIYSFARALKRAGYTLVTLTELGTVAMDCVQAEVALEARAGRGLLHEDADYLPTQ